jgi:ribonuclease III
MSQTRLHTLLQQLFLQKDRALLEQCLNHSDFLEFMQIHGLKLPMAEVVQVFTHTSFSHEYEVPHHEQLEFLGDAVLQLIMTEELYRRNPLEKEGRLSKLRSALVNEETLSILARSLQLNELILVGKGEFKKELFEQPAVLADALEALLGQIYRHQGFEFTRNLFLRWLDKFFPQAFARDFLDQFDAKSKVQEKALALHKKLPVYVSETQGDGFQVQLVIDDKVMAQGFFSSKKNGEKALAQEVLKKKLI